MRLITKTILATALTLAPISAFAADTTVSALSVSQTDYTPGAVTNVSFTFTTAAPTSSDIIFTLFNDADGINSDYDVSAITIDFGDLAAYSTDTDILSDQSFFGSDTFDAVGFNLDSELPAGTYTVTLQNVMNPSVANSYRFGASTASEGALLTSSAYTLSDLFNIYSFDTTALTGLKTKDVTKQAATLKWNAYSGTGDVTYTVTLYKKNGDKLKTFKNLTALKKDIAKSSGLLKAGKTYKFRVKACDATDEETCTTWSSYKSFTTKS